jgi:hypothetical protein
LRNYVARVTSLLPKIALVAALASSIGLHWGFLQTVAWVGMVVNYSQEAPFKDAVVMTFDGKHPCSLCKQIAQGKRSEKKSEFPPASKKFEFSYSVPAFVFTAPSGYWEVRWPDDSAPLVALTPPVPPPRQLPG